MPRVAARALPTALAIALGATLAACASPADDSVRGHGLVAASLSPNDQARVYEAAARAAYDVSDASLSLLVDPRLLPRQVGLAPAGTLPASVTRQMRSDGVAKGTCEPPLRGVVGTAHCTAALPGYVLRFSAPLQMPGDTILVYLYSQAYDTPASGVSQTLRFERAYKLVRGADGWRAAAEGNVPKDVRGDSR